MNTRYSEFRNQSLSMGRISERREFLDFPEIVRGMKRELRCLLRENIRLRIVARHAAGGRAKTYRGEIRDLIGHLVLDARDAMPAGGALYILTGYVALDAGYARTHPEISPGDNAMLTIRDTGKRSNAANLEPPGGAGPPPTLRRSEPHTEELRELCKEPKGILIVPVAPSPKISASSSMHLLSSRGYCSHSPFLAHVRNLAARIVGRYEEHLEGMNTPSMMFTQAGVFPPTFLCYSPSIVSKYLRRCEFICSRSFWSIMLKSGPSSGSAAC
jgi:hypothetical protein